MRAHWAHRNVHIHIFLAVVSSAFSDFKTLFWRARSVFTVSTTVQMKRAAQQTSGTCFAFQVSAVKAERGDGCSRGNVFSQKDGLVRSLRAEKEPVSALSTDLACWAQIQTCWSHAHCSSRLAVARINLNYKRLIFIPVTYFLLATDFDCCTDDNHFPLIGAVSREDSLILLIMWKDSCSQTEKHESFFHHD